MAWDRKVPFLDGKMLDYCDGWTERYYDYDEKVQKQREISWEPVAEFKAMLKLTGQARGRSAASFYLDDLTSPGRSYVMKFGAFYDAIIAFGAKPGGEITGTWTFAKQGANYSLIPVEAK